jgi:DNA ligase (NAD+)
MNTTRIAELSKQIAEANDAYYNGRDSGLEDAAYDKLVDELKSLAPGHPLTKSVGAKVAGASLAKVKHSIPMGSQQKAMNESEFRSWVAGMDGIFPRMVASLKLDGFSLAAYYKGGILRQVVGRGDGYEGEDLTANALRFKNLPDNLHHDFTGAVRGEGVMLMDDWKAVDPDQTSNPRNLAAGIGRRKDGTDADRVTFYAFDITNKDIDYNTEEEKNTALKWLGFTIAPCETCVTLDKAISYYKGITPEIRAALPFWIDGVIFKVNSLDLQEMLGVTDNRPKGQIAWKFKAEEATSTVEGVEITVGHTGKIIPTAKLRPVQIGGTTVSSVLLCNWEEIARLDVAIGDQVVVIKAGDIIPKIIEVTHRPRGYQLGFNEPEVGGRRPIAIPATCPVCGGPVGKKKNTGGDDTADLYCLNDECDAKSTGKIKRWIKSLDIKGIGDEVLEALVEKRTTKGLPDFPGDKPGTEVTHSEYQFIYDPADLYTMAQDELAELLVNGRKLGWKRAKSIIEEVEKTEKLTIDQFLGSLGVKGLGKRKVQLIREAWHRVNDKSGYLPEWLDEPRGWFTDPRFGSKIVELAPDLGIPGIAGEIQADLDSKRPLIEKFLKFIDIVSPEYPGNPTTGPLAGSSFCLTGTLSKPRKEIQAAILAAGGAVKDDVATGVTHLVQADASSQSSKSKKAQKLGVKVISEDELNKMMGVVA